MTARQHTHNRADSTRAGVLTSLRGRLGVANLGSSRGIPRKRGRRPVPQHFPQAIVQSYFTDLRRILNHARDLVEKELVPQLDRLVRVASSERGEPLRDHADAAGDDVDKIMDRVARRFWDTMGVDRLRQVGRGLQRANRLEQSADETARALGRYQKDQLDRQIRSIIGVNLGALSEPNIQGQIQAFTKTNVALIKSIPQQFFDQVEARVVAGVNAGDRPEAMVKEIAERFQVSESRAALIANDQVGKFYGKLNEVRQKHLGIDGYIWRTVGDDRVRLEHRSKDGKRFKWDDPPADTGHPGEDINCRCYPEPDLTDLAESLGEAPEKPEPEEQPEPEAPPPPPEPEPEPEAAPEPEEAPPTFSGPDGAKYAQQFPELAQAFGPKLHVTEGKLTREHLEGVMKIPMPILEKLGAAMNEVRIGHGKVNKLGGPLSPRIPRRDANVALGVFESTTRAIVAGDGLETGGMKGIVTHELGHAADALLSGSRGRFADRPEFQVMWRESMSKGEIKNAYATTKPRECFAECWREILIDGEDKARPRFGDKITDAVRDFIADVSKVRS